MFPELSLESLGTQNAKLVNNYNTLKKIISVYENNTTPLKDSHEAKIQLNQCIAKHVNTGPLPPNFAQSSPLLIKELEIKNAELEIKISKFFDHLQDIEKLQKHFHQELNLLSPEEEIQELPHTSHHEGSVDTEEVEQHEPEDSLHTKCQDLVQSITDVQNQKKQLEKLNSINETIIGKLNEENDVLQKKVKQLENDVQNLSPVSDRIAYFLMTKTNIEAERKKYQEELNSLLKERIEVEDMEEDLNEQLTRMKDFSHYINLIKELEKQVDDLRDSVKMIKHKKKKKQSALCKEVRNFFLSESGIIKANVEFLIREKWEVKKKAENMEKELKLVENILTVYGNIQETHQKELDDLREKMRNCDDTLQKSGPSLCQRFLNLFCPGGESSLKDLKEMHKNKKHCKFLSEQLEVLQQMLCTQEITAEKLKTKISRLHERARILDYNLLEINSLALKNQKVSRLYI